MRARTYTSISVILYMNPYICTSIYASLYMDLKVVQLYRCMYRDEYIAVDV